ncbi:MAG: SRPBCC family protein [Gemmatimonadaceae bacterium]|nr:SRPBCC family protein [Gemmatimonadaceae bacterium]
MADFEGTVTVRCTPAVVFALYADAAGWAAWDPDIRGATREGPFVSGAVGTITPKQGPTMTIRLTSVVPDRSFDAEARLPGCTMRFEHWLEPQGDSTRVTHRVVFTGPLAFVFRALIGPGLRRGIPGTMAGLKAAAEARAAAH